jgi:hypothetical protein
MGSSAKRASLVLSFAMFALLSLQGCADLFPEFDANIKKAVVMKYVHLANVRQFQTHKPGVQLEGVQDGSFWAVFELCSLDVQGSALSGFNYDAAKFFVEAADGTRYPKLDGIKDVAASDATAMTSADAYGAASDAFSLSPTPQYFPKQFYPNLNYRIAIFVREQPTGYRGESLMLNYDGQPQVAALVQGVSSDQPSFVGFFNSVNSSLPTNVSCP